MHGICNGYPFFVYLSSMIYAEQTFFIDTLLCLIDTAS